MQLISRGTGGGGANGVSSFPRLSADGRYVVFQSNASNLVDGRRQRGVDIFVFDRADQVMKRVSVARSTAAEATGRASRRRSATTAASSPMPRAPPTWSPHAHQRRVRADLRHRLGEPGVDLAWRASAGRHSRATRSASSPALTAGAAPVAFKSEAFNLVPGDTNGVPDVFVRDRRHQHHRNGSASTTSATSRTA